MRSPRWMLVLMACTAACVVLAVTSTAVAEEVWSGRTYYFEKEDWADWTLAENQDRITDNVWLTRADMMGLFNIVLEDQFDNSTFLSPLDTEWAVGDAVDWPVLTFTTWDLWHGASPPTMVGVDSVVHLISDDIYIDIVVVGWTQGAQGGGFAYYRAPGAQSPVEPASWGAIKALYR